MTLSALDRQSFLIPIFMKAIVSPKHIISAFTFLNYLVPKKKDPDNVFLFDCFEDKGILRIKDELHSICIWIPLEGTTQLALLSGVETDSTSMEGSFSIDARSLPKLSITMKNIQTSDICELTKDTLLIGESFKVNLAGKEEALSEFTEPRKVGGALATRYYLKNFAAVLNKFPSVRLTYDPVNSTVFSLAGSRFFSNQLETFPHIGHRELQSFTLNTQLFKKLTTYFEEFYYEEGNTFYTFSEESERYYVMLPIELEEVEVPKILSYLETNSTNEPFLQMDILEPKKVFDDIKLAKSMVSKEDDLIEMFVDDDNFLSFRPYDKRSVAGVVNSVKVYGTGFERTLYLKCSELIDSFDTLKNEDVIKITTWPGQKLVMIASRYKTNVLIPLLTA